MAEENKRKSKQTGFFPVEDAGDNNSEYEEQLLEKQEREAEFEHENDYFRETISIIKNEILRYVSEKDLTLCEFLSSDRDLEKFLHFVIDS